MSKVSLSHATGQKSSTNITMDLDTRRVSIVNPGIPKKYKLKLLWRKQPITLHRAGRITLLPILKKRRGRLY